MVAVLHKHFNGFFFAFKNCFHSAISQIANPTLDPKVSLRLVFCLKKTP